MPVRFRCSYCNQLLGISRRKIGLTVKCPTCQGQVIVPPHDTEEKPAVPGPQPVIGPQRDFEQSDFLQMLEQHATAPAAVERPIAQERLPDFPMPAAAANGADVDVVPLKPQSTSTGLMVLTPLKLTILVVVMIIALAMAFAAGVVVGKFMSGWGVPKGSVIEESVE